MKKIAIVGGSQPALKEFVKKAKEKYKNKVEFHVFDTEPNIGSEDLWTYHQSDTEEQMALDAVKMAYKNEIDVIVKGIVSTHNLLKAVLNKKHSLKKQDLLSHVSVIDLPKEGKKILLTDAAMNITPNEEQLIGITDNVIEVANKFGYENPKVALISSAETYNEKMPSSVLATNVTKYFENDDRANVYGPLSLDLALSKEAVLSKGFQADVAGDAEVIVVPNIDVGNVLYKSLVLFGEATAGGILVGTTVPIVLTSRSDSTDCKLIGLDLALNQI